MKNYLVLVTVLTSIALITWAAKNAFWPENPVIPTVASTVTTTRQTKESSGAITVDVTPTSLRADQPAVFQVRFTTHSGNPVYNLKDQSVLIDDAGKSYTFTSWDGNSEGHHVLGNLTFQALESSVHSVNLTIKAVGGQDRSFSWNIN